jgi:hypothetical protein
VSLSVCVCDGDSYVLNCARELLANISQQLCMQACASHRVTDASSSCSRTRSYRVTSICIVTITLNMMARADGYVVQLGNAIQRLVLCLPSVLCVCPSECVCVSVRPFVSV